MYTYTCVCACVSVHVYTCTYVHICVHVLYPCACAVCARVSAGVNAHVCQKTCVQVKYVYDYNMQHVSQMSDMRNQKINAYDQVLQTRALEGVATIEFVFPLSLLAVCLCVCVWCVCTFRRMALEKRRGALFAVQCIY